MPRNARGWFGRAKHENRALVDQDVYASEDFSEIQKDDEFPGEQPVMGTCTQIAIVRPRNFRDAATVGEYYRQETPVIINLEELSNGEAWRIMDFVSGLILGLDGDIERVSRRAFLIVPLGVTILTAHNSLSDKGFFNQL